MAKETRTKKTKVKSELDFFITPFIVRHRLDSGVFTEHEFRKIAVAREKARQILAEAELRELQRLELLVT